jgi:hypothetical protein
MALSLPVLLAEPANTCQWCSKQLEVGLFVLRPVPAPSTGGSRLPHHCVVFCLIVILGEHTVHVNSTRTLPCLLLTGWMIACC